MDKYSTMVIVSRDIYSKIEFYRQFLEKSEFGILLERTCFVCDDSVGELSPAGLSNLRTCISMYGLISKEEYTRHYAEAEKMRIEYPNPNYYMLFCQEKYCDEAYNTSELADASVLKTFSIGVVEENDFAKEELDQEALRDELRCIKLLALCFSVCIHNQNSSPLRLERYYMTANVKLNYSNVYFAVLHKLSKYADEISEKQRIISANEEAVEFLQNRKPCKCRGHFVVDSVDMAGTRLKKFSSYKSMITLRREMEAVYEEGMNSFRQDVSRKVRIARYALAEAEEHSPVEYITDGSGRISVRHQKDSSHSYRYMDATEAEQVDIAEPDDLLDRPGHETSFDATRLRSILPLAREFEKRERPHFGKFMLAAVFCIVLFALGVGLTYLVRYLTVGLVGVDRGDVILMLSIPAALLVLAAVTGFVIHLIHRIQCRKVFKNLYNALRAFLSEISAMCVNIGNYINDYLTVCFNHHLRYSKIEKLNEHMLALQNDIETVEAKIIPANAIADKVCRLTREKLEVPEIEPADKKRGVTLAEVLVGEISHDVITTADRTLSSARCNHPFADKISFAIGNINS